MDRLQNKLAIVTGASRGIGRAIALRPGTDFSGVVEAVGAQAMMLVVERRLRLALEEHPLLTVNREEGVA